MEDFKTFVKQQNSQAADNKKEINAKEKIAFFKDKVNDLYCKIDNEWRDCKLKCVCKVNIFFPPLLDTL